MSRISVPTISENLGHYDQLFEVWRVATRARDRLDFDFSRCTFLAQNGVAFLGGLSRLLEYRGSEVSFDWGTLRADIRMNLAQNGFLSAFGIRVQPWTGNSIPYREDPELDKDALVDYLADRWLGRNWVHMSDGLRYALAARVCEIYVNAFEHSNSTVGVFSCGQHYPNLKMLRLTVVDFGMGIPGKIRAFYGDPTIIARSAMKWAFQRGTTTRPRAGGGVGLDLLKGLVRLNGGALSVFSHEGYAISFSKVERYETRSSYFEGTMVTITLRCDERHYQLMSERTDERLF